jgi:hypothetical protein
MDEIDQLIAQLKSPDKKERGGAANKLKELAQEISQDPGLTKAVTPLADALKEEGSTGNYAAHALGHIGAESIPQLTRILNEDDFTGRNNAALAVETMAHRYGDLGKLEEVLGGDRAMLMIPPLVRDLRHKLLRFNASSAIYYISEANIGNPKLEKIIPELISTMKIDIDAYPIIKALGAIGSPKAIIALVGIFGYKEPFVRADSLKALERIIGNCDSAKKLSVVEKRMIKGFANLIEKHSDTANELQFFKMKFAQLRNSIAKRRDALAVDRGILLDDKPKPPKRNQGTYRALARSCY